MSKNRTGNFIAGGNPQTPSLSSNNGVFDTNEVYENVSLNRWQSAGSGAYEIARSLRFRSGASAYLSRVPSTSSSIRTAWTWSAWVKNALGNSQLFGVTSGVGNTSTQEDNRLAIQLGSDGTFQFYEFAGGGFSSRKYSAPKFRDPSAWYHLILAVDYSKPNGNDRIKMYVNGVEVTTFDSTTTPSLNLTSYMNGSGNNHTIGGQIKQYNNFYDGYITELNLIDGQQLDPSYFGYFDPITNIWQPKKYTGGYGTNGFYLPFTDNASVQTLGRNYTSNYVADNNNIAASSWSKVNSVTATANSAVAPDGTTTASSLIENSLASNNWVNQATGFTTISGNVYTTSAFIKPVGRTWVMIQNDNFTNGGAGRPYAWFNLSGSGAVGNTNSTNASILPLANGWYRCTMTTTVPSTNSGETFYVGIYPAPSNGTLVNPGTGTTALRVWGVAANAGSSLNTLGNVPFNATSPINPTGGGDWTPNNFSLTAGATYDSMADSPTNVFTTATDTGGVVIGNYATLNPLIPPFSSASVYLNSNLRFTVNSNGGATDSAYSTIPMSSGKWYAECTVTATPSAGTAWIGVCNNVDAIARGLYGGGVRSTGYAYRQSTGNKCNGDNTGTAYGASYTTGDIISVALDLDARNITFYKNNVSQGVAFTNITSNDGNFVFGVDSDPVGTFTWNFGQQPFTYAPPTGFKSLNTTNLQALGTSVTNKAAITPNKYFDISLYPGNSSTQRIVNSGGFQPDLVWGKSRNIAENNALFDSVRGASRALYSNLTNVEATDPGVSEFNTNGFLLNGATINATSYAYVAWQWKAGGASAVTNTAGTVLSQVSASPTSGFSIVTYTANATDPINIGHGLGVAPSMFIVKSRSAAGTDWFVYHKALGATKNMRLNTTGAEATATNVWNNTAPTANVITTSNAINTNTQTYLAYCFAEIPGFSKFGSYTGNSSANGPFVYCGFRPRWIFIRSTTGAREWNCWDTARGPYNIFNGGQLAFDSAHAEYITSGYNDVVDFLSNGFKLRSAASPNYNQGETYIFGAFAESPFALNNRAR